MLALFVLAGGLPAAGASDNPLAGAAPAGDVIRGRFTQDKYLAELDQPLTSSGHFVAARGRGLLWCVDKPFATTLVIDPSHLEQRVDGRRTLQLNSDEQPGLRVVAAALVAVFQADLDRLRDFFTIEPRPAPDDGWRLVLQPTAPGVSEFVQRLTLSGAERVQRIAIEEPGGDRSVIHLQFAPGPAGPLTDAERRAFGD